MKGLQRLERGSIRTHFAEMRSRIDDTVGEGVI